MDHRDLLPKIKAPTLVVAGKYDPATPPEANEYIKNHIPGARYTVLEAAHLSNAEQADAYTNAVLGFLLDRSKTQAPIHSSRRSRRTPLIRRALLDIRPVRSSILERNVRRIGDVFAL